MRPEQFPSSAHEVGQLLLLSIVVIVLVLSGPLVPGLSFTQAVAPTDIGDGNATLSSVTLETDQVQITPGRFGTDVHYLRMPDARTDVASVSGRPRIVYRIRILELGLDHDSTQIISHTGRTTVRLDDRAVRSSRLETNTLTGYVTVRVQSFTVDRTIRNETVAIDVIR